MPKNRLAFPPGVASAAARRATPANTGVILDIGSEKDAAPRNLRRERGAGWKHKVRS
jgi:hypothetical protein